MKESNRKRFCLTELSALITEENTTRGSYRSWRRVKEIHREYLEAGAQILRTNTFAANSFCMDIPREQIGETLRSGLRLAREAVAEWRETTGETKEIYIAADMARFQGRPWHRKML